MSVEQLFEVHCLLWSPQDNGLLRLVVLGLLVAFALSNLGGG